MRYFPIQVPLVVTECIEMKNCTPETTIVKARMLTTINRLNADLERREVAQAFVQSCCFQVGRRAHWNENTEILLSKFLYDTECKFSLASLRPLVTKLIRTINKRHCNK